MAKTEWTRARWKKEADAWFSRYIRQRDKGRCYTCELSNNPKKMQNGHFVPRQYLATRFDEVNCHCQCYTCNVIYSGQASSFAQHLVQDYGHDIIKQLEDKRLLIIPDMNYEKIAHEYQAKYEALVLEQNTL